MALLVFHHEACYCGLVWAETPVSRRLAGWVNYFCLGPRTGLGWFVSLHEPPAFRGQCTFLRELHARNVPVHREEETEPCQTGLRRPGENPTSCHREAKVTAPLLDSTQRPYLVELGSRPYSSVFNKRQICKTASRAVLS